MGSGCKFVSQSISTMNMHELKTYALHACVSMVSRAWPSAAFHWRNRSLFRSMGARVGRAILLCGVSMVCLLGLWQVLTNAGFIQSHRLQWQRMTMAQMTQQAEQALQNAKASALAAVPVVLWLKGKFYSLSVSATDPEGDAISLVANTSSISGAVFTDAGNGSGTLSWNTSGAGADTYNILVTATANGLISSATLRIKVENDELYWQ